MKNKLILIIVITILFICVIAIWLILNRGDEVKEDQAVKEKTSQTRVEKEEQIAARLPKVVLSLDINGRRKQEAIQGTPLFLRVALRNASAHKAARTQSLIKYYSDKSYSEEKKDIQQKILDSLNDELEATLEETVVLSSERYNSAEWISLQILSEGEYQPLPWNIEALTSPDDKKISLDGETIALLEYGVSPEAVKDIQEGDYIIRAQLISGLASEVKEVLESNTASLKIIEEKKASEKMLIQRTLLCGRYYLKKGDMTEAEQYAQQLRDNHPEYVPGLMLTGKIYEEMGNDEEAYLTYQEAMNVLGEKKAKEPPPFLIEKINKFLFESKEKVKKEY